MKHSTKWAHANPERHREQTTRWRNNNLERVHAINKRWRDKNRFAIKIARELETTVVRARAIIALVDANPKLTLKQARSIASGKS